MTVAQAPQPTKQQSELATQRELARSILERMEREETEGTNTVLCRPVDWDAMEAQAGASAARDRNGDRVHRPKHAYRAADLDLAPDTDQDGHRLWTGPTRRQALDQVDHPFIDAVHELCGLKHYHAAKAFKEEALGQVIDRGMYTVVRCCAEDLCVAPEHFVVRRRGE